MRVSMPSYRPALAWRATLTVVACLGMVAGSGIAAEAATASTPSNATPIVTDYYAYKCLSTTTSGSINTATLATCNYSSNSYDAKQYWTSTSAAPNEVINYSTKKCLTAQSDAGVYMSACNNSSAQKWNFSGIKGNGTFQSNLNGLCLAATSSNTVTTAKCSSAGSNTGWTQPVGGGNRW